VEIRKREQVGGMGGVRGGAGGGVRSVEFTAP